MPARYTADDLLHLRQSPLCRRPDNLPPPEEWMGAPAEQIRTQNKTSDNRPRTGDNPLLDQTNRRPTAERHLSRNSANPEDIVFAPPRMAFASARGNKSFENEPAAKDADAIGRFSLRGRNGDSDLDRLRNGRGANPLRRGDGEDTEGWSTVKPRKSFGHEGAERFHGKMGGNYREERRPARERDPVDVTPRDRAPRTLDGTGRDREVEDAEGRARNGPGRGKLDLWHRNDNDAPTPEKRERERERERGDKMRSWRDRDPQPEPSDDRSHGRNQDRQDRRWGRDRDQRVEREPEWLDEPNEGQREAHTQQDFQKWMESMKKAKSGASNKPEITIDAAEAAAAAIEAGLPSVKSAPAVEPAQDQFFMTYGLPSAGAVDPTTPGEQKEVSGSNKPKSSSKFASFFGKPQDEPRGRTEPSTPLAGPLLNLLAGPSPGAAMHQQPQPPQAQPHHHQPPAPEEERQAFQQLLAKLQKQTFSVTPPAASPFTAPNMPQPGNPMQQGSVASPEPFQQYGGAGEGIGRPPSHHVQEILAPRPQPQARPDQLLQDLVGQHQRTSSQGSGRPQQGVTRNNSNTEFLMNLMRAGPETQRPDQHMMQMPPQQQKQQQQQGPAHMSQLNEREPDFPRDNRGGHPRQMRPQPPPGFPMEESFHGHDQESHSRLPNQPTQILQRPPPPPGLDQMPPNWMPGGAQMPPPPPGPQQQRGPMMPPPGLAGGPGRNVPLPHMFPPNFPPGAMPPPEVMGAMPPRNMPPPPPPGFFNGPPHGFMPPGLAGFNGPPGPGPEGHVYGRGPFEGRAMPPPGNPGRGAQYGGL